MLPVGCLAGWLRDVQRLRRCVRYLALRLRLGHRVSTGLVLIATNRAKSDTTFAEMLVSVVSLG